MYHFRVGNFQSTVPDCQAIRKCLADISRMEDLALKTLRFTGYKYGVKINLPLDLESLTLLSKRLLSLDLSMVTLSTEELQTVFQALASAQPQARRMRSLNIRNNSLADLSQGSSQLADVVVNRLVEVNMSGCQLTVNQITEVLQEIIGSCKRFPLRSLTLGYNSSVSKVSEELLGLAVSRLTEVNLSSTNLTTRQTEVVLSQIVSSSTASLESLCLGNVNMSELDPKLIGVAICKLKKVQIWNTKLSPFQLRTILRMISRDQHKRLEVLDIEGNDVHSVLPETLGQAVLSLRSADLHNCKVTKGQVDFIFNRLADLPPQSRRLRVITLTDKQSVNYKKNKSLPLNLDFLRGHKMFLITKRFLQFHGLNDTKNFS